MLRVRKVREEGLCPAGVVASEKQYYVYVSGTGTAEAALVTGGSCAGNGSSGTLQFTTVNAPATGYTISSATAGIQEASIAAKLDVLSGNRSFRDSYVRLPPGIHHLYAPLSSIGNDQTIDFSGSILNATSIGTASCWGARTTTGPRAT
jgi:hypothetical protein